MAIDDALELRLRRMLDIQDIRDVLMRYCRGVDRGEPSLIEQAYHPDAIDDHGDFVARGADIPELFAKMSGRSPFGGMHFIGNVLIEVEGETAYAESYFMAIKDVARDGKRHLRVRAGRYVDRFERRDGQWRIIERVLADEWNRIDETVASLGGPERYRFGKRGAEDPVFAIREKRVARDELSDLAEVGSRSV